MKENKKAVMAILKKNAKRQDKFENMVLNLALRKMDGAKKDDCGVYYSKNQKHLVMSSKTLEGEYVVKEGTQEIDDNAFWGCVFITKIVLPESITTIGDEAFGRCLSLKGLTIPASVTKMGDNPFIGMDADNLSVLSPNYAVEGKILYTADKKRIVSCLTNAAMVIVPKTVATIGDKAFARRRELKKIVLPDGVKTIGEAAFADCDALEEVVIPATVNTIERFAFAECDKLKKVTFAGEVKHLSRTALMDCDNLQYIYVPDGMAPKFSKQLHISPDSDILILEETNKK